MSFRLFCQPRKDSASDYIKKMSNREKFQHVKILYNSPTDGQVEDYNDTCFKIQSCNQITSIKDYNILQELRITRCILNKIIVISEHAMDDILYPLNAYIIFCDYRNIVYKTKEVLNNYNEYYDKIYKNIDYEEIKKKYEQHLIKF